MVNRDSDIGLVFRAVVATGCLTRLCLISPKTFGDPPCRFPAHSHPILKPTTSLLLRSFLISPPVRAVLYSTVVAISNSGWPLYPASGLDPSLLFRHGWDGNDTQRGVHDIVSRNAYTDTVTRAVLSTRFETFSFACICTHTQQLDRLLWFRVCPSRLSLCMLNLSSPFF